MKKEFYRKNLPHFQTPGQAFFITWNLQNAVPKKALQHYSDELIHQQEFIQVLKQSKRPQEEINKAKSNYNVVRKKYIDAYNNLLDQQASKDLPFSLLVSDVLKVIKASLHFWENKKLETYAYCIMPNHVHWVVWLYPKTKNGDVIYLQDIMHSVKRYSAREINKLLNRDGKLWQHESFDVTIRDNNHLQTTIEYTLYNPVKAGLVNSTDNWLGSYYNPDL